MSNKHAADSDFLKNLRKDANKNDVENDAKVEFQKVDNAYEQKLKEKDKEI